MSNLVKKNLFWPSTTSVDDFINENFFNWPSRNGHSLTVPKVNITESDDDFRVELAAPGMKSDDFRVELDNDILVIWLISKEKNAAYARKEFSYESFRRSFHLPNTKIPRWIAKSSDPKKEEARRKPAKQIKIS